MAKDQKVTLQFTLTDDSKQAVSFTVPAGTDGAKGDKGDDGAKGVGITSVTVTQEDVN